ncbi:DUF4175 domain-containing protein [Trichocoleus desertorum AS-A10]|uniref:hypothetical protein n=1 Tax=Trichocoleus desertorum TaxID=1481672 RepID=UPI003299F12C
MQCLEQIDDGDSDPVIKRRIDELRQEVAQEMRQLQYAPCLNETVQKIIHHPQTRNAQFWQSLTAEERKVVYHKLVSQVFVLNGSVISVQLQF